MLNFSYRQGPIKLIIHGHNMKSLKFFEKIDRQRTFYYRQLRKTIDSCCPIFISYIDMIETCDPFIFIFFYSINKDTSIIVVGTFRNIWFKYPFWVKDK